MGQAGVSGGVEKRSPPNAASVSLERAHIEHSARPGAGGETKRVGRGSMHRLSPERWRGARGQSASRAVRQKQRETRARAQNFARRGWGRGRGAGRFGVLGGVRERERKRRHKGRGSTTEPRSSSKWRRPALCLPTSCGRMPTEVCAVRGLQVWQRRGKGKLQDKPGHAGTLEHKHNISLRGKWAERRTAAHLGESECGGG